MVRPQYADAVGCDGSDHGDVVALMQGAIVSYGGERRVRITDTHTTVAYERVVTQGQTWLNLWQSLPSEFTNDRILARPNGDAVDMLNPIDFDG